MTQLGPSYANLSFSSSYERQLDKRHGQILMHDASFRFMFLYLYVILVPVVPYEYGTGTAVQLYSTGACA